MQLSHEAIYQSLFIQTRGVLKKELVAHLRSRRMMRRFKLSTSKCKPRGQIVDAVSIRERPGEVTDPTIPGHLEGDLISGSHNSHIATLVERHSRFIILERSQAKTPIALLRPSIVLVLVAAVDAAVQHATVLFHLKDCHLIL